MARKQIMVPTGGVPPFKLIDVRPVYGIGGEVPIHRWEGHDGSLLFYGSGKAVAVVADLPITINVPWGVVQGRLSWGLSAAVRGELTMALRKVLKVIPGPETAGSGAEDAVLFPTIWEHLTATTYPDGEKRETSSIVIVADASGWRGCLSDKDNARTMWKTGPTVEAVLLALEDGAAKDDPAEWRQSAWAKGKGKKRA